jgi:hypothetical protein
MHNLWSKAVVEQALFDAAAKTINFADTPGARGGVNRDLSPKL